MTKIHKNQPDIPTDIEEKKSWIDWLFAHRIWAVPIGAHDDISDEVLEMIGGLPEEGDKVIYDNRWHQCVSIRPAYVHPETREIEDDESQNTHFEIWVEAGPMIDVSKELDWPEPEEGWDEENKWMGSHDLRLDCGADDYETAILTLAARVKTFYKEDGTLIDLWPCDFFDGDKQHSAEDEGFCVECGFAVTEVADNNEE